MLSVPRFLSSVPFSWLSVPPASPVFLPNPSISLSFFLLFLLGDEGDERNKKVDRRDLIGGKSVERVGRVNLRTGYIEKVAHPASPDVKKCVLTNVFIGGMGGRRGRRMRDGGRKPFRSRSQISFFVFQICNFDFLKFDFSKFLCDSNRVCSSTTAPPSCVSSSECVAASSPIPIRKVFSNDHSQS